MSTPWRWIAPVLVAGALLSEMQAAAQAPPAGAAARRPAPRDAFIGVWRLLSFENIDAQGRRSHGGYDEGRIIYDPLGNMSAHLMRSKRPNHAVQPTEAERAASYSSFIAYYGRYDVDASSTAVTHHVEGALNPNWVNTDLVRYWEFSPDGTRLMLSIKNVAGRTTNTITWERMK